MNTTVNTFLADLVLITHALYVLFVIGGLVLVVFGNMFGWAWVRNFWFRTTHLAAIIVVAALTWLRIICPLTTLEAQLRLKAGQEVYEKTFVAHWLHELLFYEAPAWVFTVCYALFGLIVLAAWIFISPELPWKKTSLR